MKLAIWKLDLPNSKEKLLLVGKYAGGGGNENLYYQYGGGPDKMFGSMRNKSYS